MRETSKKKQKSGNTLLYYMRLSQTRFVYNINFYNISLFFKIFVLFLQPKCLPKCDNFISFIN